MVCPFCSYSKTQVYNSRATKRMNVLWRRRLCPHCSRQFTTYESISTDGIVRVVADKKDGEVAFSRATLLLSLVRAFDHRNDDAAYWIAETVEQKLIQMAATSDGRVTTANIKDLCLTTLKNFDQVAFGKYLSYYAPDRLWAKGFGR